MYVFLNPISSGKLTRNPRMCLLEFYAASWPAHVVVLGRTAILCKPCLLKQEPLANIPNQHMCTGYSLGHSSGGRIITHLCWSVREVFACKGGAAFA